MLCIMQEGCPFCEQAKDMLEDRDVEYEEVRLKYADCFTSKKYTFVLVVRRLCRSLQRNLARHKRIVTLSGARQMLILSHPDYRLHSWSVTTRGLRGLSGKGTVPQVFIGGHLIGGAEDLEQYLKDHPNFGQ